MSAWFRRALLFIIAAWAASVSAASAGEALSGTVVSIQRSSNQAVVSHGAFAGMPAMTMTFGLTPADARRLHAGDRIVAEADTSAEPWRLRILRVTREAPPTAPHRWVPILRPGDQLPDARFVDQDGRNERWSDYDRRSVVVSFIYTRCRDAAMCPLVSAKFRELQNALPPNTHLVEVTLDPRFDTPGVLRRYGAMFGADPRRWTFATGSVENALELATRFGIGILSNDGTTIAHSEAVGVLGPGRRVVAVIGGNQWQPQEVAALVRQSEGLRSSAWQRFVLFLRQAPRACGITDATAARIAWAVFIVAFVPVVLVLIRLLRESVRQAGE